MVNGYIHFIYPQRSISLDAIKVNDGRWHYLETRWLTGKLLLILDYGQVQLTESIDQWINGKTISRVYIGGILQKVGSTPLVITGLKGCVKVNINSFINCPECILT